MNKLLDNYTIKILIHCCFIVFDCDANLCFHSLARMYHLMNCIELKEYRRFRVEFLLLMIICLLDLHSLSFSFKLNIVFCAFCIFPTIVIPNHSACCVTDNLDWCAKDVMRDLK